MALPFLIFLIFFSEVDMRERENYYTPRHYHTGAEGDCTPYTPGVRPSKQE